MTKGNWSEIHTLGTLHWSRRLVSTSIVCTMEQAQGGPEAVDMVHSFPTMLTPVTTKSRRLWRAGLLNAMQVSSSVLQRGSE